MACKVPHTVEQLQMYVQKQTEKGDTDRQKAIVEVIKQFELAKALKQKLREKYQECNDISEDRKAVIDQFWYDEYQKDAAVAEKLWRCVSDIQAQISNKIRWSFEENMKAGKVEQQQQQQQQQQKQQQHHHHHQFVQGASSSSAPRVVQPQ